MDRKYIENEHIVDRYMSGDLTVREAREFEKYCLEHPQALKDMPIPVRLKARLARQPREASETGVFKAIPSSATHAAAEAADEGFDFAEEQDQLRRGYGGGANRTVVLVLGIALAAAVAGAVIFWMKANTLTDRLAQAQQVVSAAQTQAPGSVQTYKLQPVRGKPEQPTLALGWLTPPQLLELRIDVSAGKYTQFQVTIDAGDGTRVMRIHRIARDSNKELRLALNSSALGPGDYLVKIDGYTWRGQVQEVGWVRLGLQ